MLAWHYCLASCDIASTLSWPHQYAAKIKETYHHEMCIVRRQLTSWLCYENAVALATYDGISNIIIGVESNNINVLMRRGVAERHGFSDIVTW